MAAYVEGAGLFQTTCMQPVRSAVLRATSVAFNSIQPTHNLRAFSMTVGESAKVHTALVPVERKPYAGKVLVTDDCATADPVAWKIMQGERTRQFEGLELIASENFASKAVRQALSSAMSNKYSEGYPGQRYYGGNEYIDQMETLCRERALKVFGLSPSEWGVNVQPHSGSPANFAIYTALVGPHGRIMGLDLPDGGHLTHGFYTPKKKISATSIYFESMPYKANQTTGLIDYDALEANAKLFNPTMIVAGISCYARHLDYARFRQIANNNDAYLMSDMSHVSGLVAAGVVPSPFEYADVVMTTTHKSLRGPRGAMIFYRKGTRSTSAKGEPIPYQLEAPINSAVFPGLQGGPHNHTISAIAVALGQALTPEFVEYQKQVLLNAKVLVDTLGKDGYTIVTGGTDTHLCLVDLRPLGTDGARVELVLDHCGATCNKNTCPGDKSALKPGGIRLGAPALTSRGMKEQDFVTVAQFLHEGIQLTLKYQQAAGPASKTLKDFKAFLAGSADYAKDTAAIRDKVHKFTAQFVLPGFDEF